VRSAAISTLVAIALVIAPASPVAGQVPAPIAPRPDAPPAAGAARAGAPAGQPADARPAKPPVPPGAHRPPPKPPTKPDPNQREAARAKLLAKIRAVRAQELADVLTPDVAAVGKVVEIAAGFEDRLIAARQETRGHRHELDKLLKVAKPDDAAITRAVDQLLAGRRKLDEIEAERTAALRKAVTPAQFARVVVAWPRINRKIQEMLYRALLRAKGEGIDAE